MQAQADQSPSPDTLLCFALYSTVHALGRTYAPLLTSLGLTYPQYLTMLVLWDGDDVSVKTIGDRLYLDSGTLTPLLKRLEHAGLVTRCRDHADERQVKIRLTGKGRNLQRKARSIPTALARAIRQPAEKITSLTHDLKSLRSSLIASRCEEALAD